MTECDCEFPHQLGDKYSLEGIEHVIAQTNTIQWSGVNDPQRALYGRPTTVALVDTKQDRESVSGKYPDPWNPVWHDVTVVDPQNISCAEWKKMRHESVPTIDGFVFIPPPALIQLAECAE